VGSGMPDPIVIWRQDSRGVRICRSHGCCWQM